MECYGGFEANAQNIRILTKLELKNDKYDGLNLTRAVLDGQLKYKDPYSKDKRKFIYADDIAKVYWASNDARSAVEGSKSSWQSFECQIMDWADDVAYAVHDLEDSIHAGYVGEFTFRDATLREGIIVDLYEKFRDYDIDIHKIWRDLIDGQILSINPDFMPFGGSGSRREQKSNRKKVTSYLINRYIQAASREQRAGSFDESVSQRYLYKLHIPIEFRVEVALINRIIWKVVIESPQVRTMEAKGRHIIRSLFSKFMEDNNVEFLLPDDWKEFLGDSNSERAKARVVSDYISGMTDDYAQWTFAKLFLPNQGSIYEVL